MRTNAYRVLMVMDSLAVGGTETHVLSLVKGLQKLGVKPVYAGASGLMYNSFAQAACPIHAIDLTAGAFMLESSQKQTIRTLKQIIRHRKIDVVHVHQTPSGMYAAMAAKDLGIPVVFTVHGAYYPEEQLIRTSQCSDAVISVSKPVQRYLDNMGIASILVPNGIDTEEFYPVPSHDLRNSLEIADDASVVVYASRLAWDKAIVCNLLIMAAARLRKEEMPGLHVVVVGDGLQFPEINEMVKTIHKNTGQTFIHMTGNQTKVREYYGLGDIVVGTGRVALEAMACGKPVLAIGNHGFFGIVEPTVYRQAWDYYFGDHDSERKATEEAVIESLRKALSDREGLKKIGAQGRRWALKHFDINNIVAQMDEIYTAVQARNPITGV
ncbi:glycosyltransferase [Paenibacillus apiarius]|uniref:Glycosyltransferase n=1 Tax=Paenibacillus apiarius TaxID=46240 RepID=A0ABT4DWV8_9BACL|nr:glycosyltransferase [Paenibacillus apiarius]MCY9514870.1 glycosyltransferase [Paenibacillus apiarius]MCY9521250.1 glycosyltransferase [Paenibacillus apiarius]MCY9553966.1 glycosyltransferase [Paenibacillus apiarius]MCY9560340.1 glycosyltransferase [Paenibacillus apiarius]MCY9685690.1 glycosyltransferase [Paenibacillus apiarius]